MGLSVSVTLFDLSKMNAPSPKTYFANYLALLILLAATIGLSFLNLGTFNSLAALAIAFIKMLLIILFFMHVRYSSRLIWVAAATGFLWLGILIVLAMSDFITRGW
jgi:cytochrome c oxidase subunit 4